MARLTKTEMWERILEYYKLRRNVDAAEYFGLSPQTMYSRVKTGNIDFEEIYQKCPDISADWLLSGGEGEMIRPRGARAKEAIKAGREDSPVTVAEAFEALRAEQMALERSQNQITGLIELLRKE